MATPSPKIRSAAPGAHRCLHILGRIALTFGLGAGATGLTGCRSPRGQVEAADAAAYATISDVRQHVFGEARTFTVESPSDTLRRRLIEEQHLRIGDPASVSSRHARRVPHWPQDIVAPPPPKPAPESTATGPPEPVVLPLLESLQVAAHNSRAYQGQKESMFEEALMLDLRRYDFSTQLSSAGDVEWTRDASEDETIQQVTGEAGVRATRTLENGVLLSTGFTLDFLEVLKGSAESTLGLNADVSVTVPLLRGAGRHIAREPLTRAEREMLYAVYAYERYKRQFVVDIVQEYLNVLRQLDGVRNARENYALLRESVIRTQALAEEERLPGIQVDQARQDELRARAGWISSRLSYTNALDQFKITLGLPPDAALILDTNELVRVLEADVMPDLDDLEVPSDASEPAPQPWLSPTAALGIALDNRLDLKIAAGRIEDAQRQVVVAADRLRPELSLGGSAAWGELNQDSRFDQIVQEITGGSNARYSGLVTLDPALDRRVERNALRSELLTYEASVRQYQGAEDAIKLDVLEAIRGLQSVRENVVIQRNAVELALRRVESTRLFLNLDRAEVRDLLEAQSDLLDARNAYTTAQVNYRVAFLALQRDLGLLEVDEQGVWAERHYQSLLNP